jgi:hypothetical protein
LPQTIPLFRPKLVCFPTNIKPFSGLPKIHLFTNNLPRNHVLAKRKLTPQ